MIRLPLTRQRYERWRIPALFFTALASFGLLMDVSHSDLSPLRTGFHILSVLPMLFPRNIVYTIIGSILLTLSGLFVVWGLLLLFAWSSGKVALTHPAVFFFAGFSLVALCLSAAATMVYLGLNDSIPVKQLRRA
jgi:hypothetical protein